MGVWEYVLVDGCVYVCMYEQGMCGWIDGVCVGVCVYIWMGEWIELTSSLSNLVLSSALQVLIISLNKAREDRRALVPDSIPEAFT